MLTPEQVISRAQSQQDHTFAECFRRYEQHLLSL